MQHATKPFQRWGWRGRFKKESYETYFLRMRTLRMIMLLFNIWKRSGNYEYLLTEINPNILMKPEKFQNSVSSREASWLGGSWEDGNKQQQQQSLRVVLLLLLFQMRTSDKKWHETYYCILLRYMYDITIRTYALYAIKTNIDDLRFYFLSFMKFSIQLSLIWGISWQDIWSFTIDLSHCGCNNLNSCHGY